MKYKYKKLVAGLLTWMLALGMLAGCGPAAGAETSEASETSVSSAVESTAMEEPFGEASATDEPLQEQSTVDDSVGIMADSLLQGDPDATEPEAGDDYAGLTPFEDVSEDAYYYESVLWAYDSGITAGASETSFAPDSVCTRAQVVTFLYRVAGRPEVEETELPFTDLQGLNEEMVEAVRWAYSEGITTGTGDGAFSPSDEVTRLQVVTFLWRLAGSPAPEGTAEAFADTDADAVLWAVENGITSGSGDGMFKPGDPCTRAQVVTFLYRYAIETGLEINLDAYAVSVEENGQEDLVALTVGTAYLAETTQEELDAACTEKGYLSAELNNDGTATLVMKQSTYDQLIATLRSNIDRSLDLVPGSEDYPEVTTVYANDDYTIFTMQFTGSTAEEADALDVTEFFLYGEIYAQYTGAEAPDVLVIIANDETGEILREARKSNS